MKLLFYLHHPAHFHLFKNVIADLSNRHQIIVLATKKDILEELLNRAGVPFINVLPNGRKDNLISVALGLLKQDIRLFNICLREKPDILIGTSTEIAHIGKLLAIPSIFVNEDDVEVIPLVGKIAYPFAKTLLVPDVCSVGKYRNKATTYAGYHELAYLHPNRFTPNKSIVRKHLGFDGPYFILRFAKLGAHHDVGIDGISDELALQLIETLSPHGQVIITSERPLNDKLEPYRLNIDPLDMHDVLAFTKLYIGDSQTMAAEAGVLGVPFIRFNDFVGRISYLKELEDKYGLGYGIKPKYREMLFETIHKLLSKENLTEEWKVKRQKMLDEKIDLTRFMIWFIENYPKSRRVLLKNPEHQFTFR